MDKNYIVRQLALAAITEYEGVRYDAIWRIASHMNVLEADHDNVFTYEQKQAIARRVREVLQMDDVGKAHIVRHLTDAAITEFETERYSAIYQIAFFLNMVEVDHSNDFTRQQKEAIAKRVREVLRVEGEE
jgi:phenylpyruvate tautomerase PptA (4-oxalocrotonate tautomerase family)